VTVNLVGVLSGFLMPRRHSAGARLMAYDSPSRDSRHARTGNRSDSLNFITLASSNRACERGLGNDCLSRSGNPMVGSESGCWAIVDTSAATGKLSETYSLRSCSKWG
jgi:hypothetical protein